MACERRRTKESRARYYCSRLLYGETAATWYVINHNVVPGSVYCRRFKRLDFWDSATEVFLAQLEAKSFYEKSKREQGMVEKKGLAHQTPRFCLVPTMIFHLPRL